MDRVKSTRRTVIQVEASVLSTPYRPGCPFLIYTSSSPPRILTEPTDDSLEPQASKAELSPPGRPLTIQDPTIDYGQTEDSLSTLQLVTSSHSVVSLAPSFSRKPSALVDNSLNAPNSKRGSIHNVGCHWAVLKRMEWIY